MLKYNEDDEKARVLAAHYAAKIGGKLLQDFMTGQAEVHTPYEAKEMIHGFWEMNDLAVEDEEQDNEVEGIYDIERWMFKLFNKVHGYMVRNGYSVQWQEVSRERKE